MTLQAAMAAILALLEERGPGKTICPSEAARRLAKHDEWRAHMESVHAAADALAARGEIALSWKGEPLDQRRGAYRFARR